MGEYGCSLFGIHSNILGSSLLVIFCRALITSLLSRSPLTLIVPTNDQLLSRSLSSQVERVIHSIPCIKHCNNCESCPLQVTRKVKFKCQICLSCLSLLSCLSCFSCLSWWPWWPRRAWYHNHENHDDQFCTFTFWQQRHQIQFRQMF